MKRPWALAVMAFVIGACSVPPAAFADWHIQFDDVANRVMHMNGDILRGHFKTRADAEAYWRSSSYFERQHSRVVGQDDSRQGESTPAAVEGPAPEPQPTAEPDPGFTPPRDIDAIKADLLASLKGRASSGSATTSGVSNVAALGLKTGSATNATSKVAALGLKTGHSSVPAVDPQVQLIQNGMRELKAKTPPPLPEVSLGFSNLSDKGTPWLMDVEDGIIYGWSVFGRVGGKALPWTNMLLIAGKVALAGGDGAEVYLVGQERLYNDAARYLKNPATAKKFAKIMDDLRHGRPVPATADPAMIHAAKAVLDPKLNHSNPVRVTWDLMMTPDAKMAMVRKAVFEAGAYMVGEGTEGIVGTLTKRADLFEQARRYRNLAKTQLRTATGADWAALEKVVADDNAFLTDLYKQQQFIPKTASYVEGLILPEWKGPGEVK